MAGEDIIRVSGNVEDFVSAKLQNAVKREYENEVDAMFGRLHEGKNADQQATNYNPSDYKRVAFDDKQSSIRFAQYMEEKGVDVVVTPIKLNGQYLAEIKNYNEVIGEDEQKDTGISYSQNDDSNLTSGSQDNKNHGISDDYNNQSNANIQNSYTDDGLKQSLQSPSNTYDNNQSLQSNNAGYQAFEQNNQDNGNNYNNLSQDLSSQDLPSHNPSSFDTQINSNESGSEEAQPISNAFSDFQNEVRQDYNDFQSSFDSSVYDNSNQSANNDNLTNYNNSNNLNNPINVNDVNKVNNDYQPDTDNGYQPSFEQEVPDTPTTQNEQYRTETDFSGNTGLTEHKDSESTLNQEGATFGAENYALANKTQFISADELLEGFKEETFIEVKKVKELEGAVEAKPVQAREVTYHITRHLDTLGTTIDGVNKILRMGESFGNNAESDMFTQKLNHDGVANPRLNAGKSEKAIVLNGDTVVINGEIVTDEKLKAKILEKHDKRIVKADGNVKKIDRKINAGKNTSDTQKRIKANSEKMIDNVYRQEYVSEKVVSVTANGGASYIKGGYLDELVKNINTEAIALSLSGTAIILNEKETALLTKAFNNGKVDGVHIDEISNILNKKIDRSKIEAGANPALFKELNTYKERWAVEDTLKNLSKSKVNLTADEKETLKNLLSEERGLKLNSNEASMFTANKNIIKSLEKDFGFNFVDGKIGRQDIIDLNKAFFKRAEEKGYQFVTVNKFGKTKFNEEMLLNLTDAQLKGLGISRDSAKVIAEFNKKGAIGKTDFQIGSIAGMALSGFFKINDDMEDLMQIKQDVHLMMTTGKHIKSASTSVVRFTKSTKAKIEIRKAKRVGKGGKTGKVSTKKPTPKTRPDKPALKVNKQANEKHLKRIDKVGRKLFKSERNIFTRIKNAKLKAENWIANTKMMKAFNALKKKIMSLLFKIAILALKVILILWLGLSVIFIAMSAIQALLDFFGDFLAPSTVYETVAYRLYEQLADHEEVWLETLDNSENLYTGRKKMNYTINGETYEQYIGNFNELKIVGDKLYIDPFHQAGNSDTDAMTEVTKYDGEINFSIGANLNYYGARYYNNSNGDIEPSADGSFVSTQSGHTSNLKDIIAMADVMYNLNMGENTDDNLENVMGQSPARLNWDNFWDNFASVFQKIGSDIGTFFKNLFTSENQPYKDREYFVETFPYKTLQTYVANLFFVSHQAHTSLHVEYHDLEKLKLNVNGTPTEVNLSQEEASKLGICTSPVTKKFPIMWVNGSHSNAYVTPTLYANGAWHNLTNGDFEINVKMDNLVEGEEVCIWRGMGSNAETYEGITNRPCWDKTTSKEDESATTGEFGDFYDNKTGLGNNNANASAKAKLKEIYDDLPDGEWGEEYYLSSNRNLFQKYYSKKKFNWGSGISYEYEEREVEDGTEMKPNYWLQVDENGNGYGSWSVNANPNNGAVIKITKIQTEVDEAGNVNDIGSTVSHEITHGNYKEISGNSQHDSYLTKEEVEDGWRIKEWNVYKSEVTKYKTQYRARATSVLSERHKEEFKRNCDGHKFKYCGGHVGANLQGIVYSATNEQMSAIAMHTHEDHVPLADGYDLEERGHDVVKGKYDKNAIDYSTAYIASTTGGSRSPVYDVQGSLVAQRGLNLYMLNRSEEGDAESIGKGVRFRFQKTLSNTSISDDYTMDMMYFVRDIFDIDCALDKGSNIFPWGKNEVNVPHFEKYTGWDMDNMTLALMKITSDWNEYYGFDIPYEINGQVPLSEDDVEKIITELKANYGESIFNDYGSGVGSHLSEDEKLTRQQTIELALRWVGRGQYSEHHDHDFLNQICAGRTFRVTNAETGEAYTTNHSVSCTAGNEKSFVNFLYRSASRDTPSDWGGVSSADNCLPADVLKHEANDDYRQLRFSSAPTSATSLVDYGKEAYVFYVGKLHNDVTLDSGTVLSKDKHIVIDLTDDGIALRYEEGDYSNTDGVSVPAWVTKTDGKTKRCKFK